MGPQKFEVKVNSHSHPGYLLVGWLKCALRRVILEVTTGTELVFRKLQLVQNAKSSGHSSGGTDNTEVMWAALVASMLLGPVLVISCKALYGMGQGVWWPISTQLDWPVPLSPVEVAYFGSCPPKNFGWRGPGEGSFLLWPPPFEILSCCRWDWTPILLAFRKRLKAWLCWLAWGPMWHCMLEAADGVEMLPDF